MSARILSLLALLAEQSGENVSPARLEFMTRKLLVHDPHEVATALEHLLESSRRFPTLAEIKSEMGCEPLSDEDKGREVADRIWSCLTRGMASSLSADVRAYRDGFVGPIGVEVVRQMGGWQRLAEVCQEDEETTRKAQWRETARIIAQKGGLGDAPQYDHLPPRPEVNALASRMDAKEPRGFIELSQPKEKE